MGPGATPRPARYEREPRSSRRQQAAAGWLDAPQLARCRREPWPASTATGRCGTLSRTPTRQMPPGAAASPAAMVGIDPGSRALISPGRAVRGEAARGAPCGRTRRRARPTPAQPGRRVPSGAIRRRVPRPGPSDGEAGREPRAYRRRSPPRPSSPGSRGDRTGGGGDRRGGIPRRPPPDSSEASRSLAAPRSLTDSGILRLRLARTSSKRQLSTLARGGALNLFGLLVSGPMQIVLTIVVARGLGARAPGPSSRQWHCSPSCPTLANLAPTPASSSSFPSTGRRAATGTCLPSCEPRYGRPSFSASGSQRWHGCSPPSSPRSWPTGSVPPKWSRTCGRSRRSYRSGRSPRWCWPGPAAWAPWCPSCGSRTSCCPSCGRFWSRQPWPWGSARWQLPSAGRARWRWRSSSVSRCCGG